MQLSPTEIGKMKKDEKYQVFMRMEKPDLSYVADRGINWCKSFGKLSKNIY